MDQLTIPELKARLAVVEEALRQAEIRATVGWLAVEMIHEIRNPLEAMNSLIFLARQVTDDPDRVKTYLELAEEQMASLRYVSTKALNYSQVAFRSRSLIW